MKIIVMGAGIVGVATAWYLREAGHNVIVVDQEDGEALGTSFANAGQLSYGYTTPWAAPNIPFKVMKWLFKKHSCLVLRPDWSVHQIKWLWQMLQNCNENAYVQNKNRMVRISEYNRFLMAQMAKAGTIDFEGRQLGTLQLFRTQKQIDAATDDMKVLQDYGIPFELLDAQSCLQYEPALANAKDQGILMGGLHLPNDATGDCHLFTNALATQCEMEGVEFHYGQKIEKILSHDNRITGVIINGEAQTADAYVCALGSFNRQLLQDLRIDLPVYPVKGYSLTVPILDETQAPHSTILDETYKVAITRFDQRIRVGGMAELSGYQKRLPTKRRETLELVLNELFPSAGDLTSASFWCGLRPMTPDSTPIIGATRFANLFINTGHGTLGWTMGLGSGKLLADLISGVQPEIEYSDLSLIRYV